MNAVSFPTENVERPGRLEQCRQLSGPAAPPPPAHTVKFLLGADGKRHLGKLIAALGAEQRHYGHPQPGVIVTEIVTGGKANIGPEYANPHR